MRRAICLTLFLGLSLFVVRGTHAEEGWQAQFEHLLLAPKLSEAGVQNIFYQDGFSDTWAAGNVGSELEYAQRLMLGYEGGQGGGARIRWFTFDKGLSYTGAVWEVPMVELNGGVNLDVDAIDAELTQRGSFRFLNLLAGAGVRYGSVSLREEEINFEDLSDTVWFGSTGVEFAGAGPTLSLQATRDIGSSGLSLFGTGRTSLLFGETERFSAYRLGGSYVNSNEVVQVWEMQLGSQYNCSLEVADLFAGIFWEAQRWDSDSDLLGDLSLHGFGVSTGLRY